MAGTTAPRAVDPPGPDVGTPTITPADVLRLTVSDAPGGRIVALSGELDIATVPIVDDFFSTLDLRASARVVVDLAALEFCGCAGLDALLRAHDRAVAAGGWLRICGATPNVRRVMRITLLSATLRCFITAADAFASRAPEQIPATGAGTPSPRTSGREERDAFVPPGAE